MYKAHLDYTEPIYDTATQTWVWAPRHNSIVVTGDLPEADYTDPLEMDANLYEALFPYLEMDGYPNITTTSMDMHTQGKAWDNAHNNKKLHPYLIAREGVSLVGRFKAFLATLGGCYALRVPLLGQTIEVPCDAKSVRTTIDYEQVEDILTYHVGYKPIRKAVTTTTEWVVNNLSRDEAEMIAKVMSLAKGVGVETTYGDLKFNSVTFKTKSVKTYENWHTLTYNGEVALEGTFQSQHYGLGTQVAQTTIQTPKYEVAYALKEVEPLKWASTCPWALEGDEEYILSTVIRLRNGYLYPEALNFTFGDLEALVSYAYVSGRTLNDENLFKIHTFS